MPAPKARAEHHRLTEGSKILRRSVNLISKTGVVNYFFTKVVNPKDERFVFRFKGRVISSKISRALEKP